MAKTISHQNDIAYFGDEDHLNLSQSSSFAGMIFELLSENKPSESQSSIFELILNLSIDHGVDAPSAVAVINCAKEGKTISESVSAGILQINNAHGGAIEPCMELLNNLKQQVDESHELEQVIQKTVADYLSQDKKMPGFGHRIYTIDPRAQLILSKLRDAGIGVEYIDLVTRISTELSTKKGRALPVNIDGAIAAALCGFGWSSKLGKAVFIIARTPGLCGQFLNV